MYRLPADPPTGGPLVTLRKYLDPVAAHLDRTRLASEGIQAHVIEAMGYNPLLAGAAGGVQLQVGENDFDRAQAILGAAAIERVDPSAGDGEDPGAVRCPSCELAYCSFEHVRLRRNSPGAHVNVFAIVGWIAGRLSPKRWHCERCGQVWDDPKEGPAEMTRLEPGDPRPVFRLRRAHGGMGLFLGLMIGLFAILVANALLPAGGLLFLIVPVLGWMIGRALRYDVCSEPECRAPLPPSSEDCPRCKGAVAGVIRAAEEHYSSAADFRRELAALRKEPARLTTGARRKKKKASAA